MTTRRATLPLCVQLPLMASVAIYAYEAIGSQHQEAVPHCQIDDLVRYALSLGYTQEQVTVFQDRKPANTPLEKREGYQALLQAIREGSVSVVLLLDIASIFAGGDEGALNKFMHLCMAKGIFVATPERVYDFSHLPLVHEFRLACTSTNSSVFLIVS